MVKPVGPPCGIRSTQEISTELSAVVEDICSANNLLCRTGFQNPCRHTLPSREVLIELVEALRGVLFPGYFGNTELSIESAHFHVGAVLDQVLLQLREQVRRGLCFACKRLEPNCVECENQALDITKAFLQRLPAVRRLLQTDVQAAFEGDPAAGSPDEAILCYPGLLAVTNHRIAHELHRLEVPLLPRIISEHAHSITGIDIHPGASIGESFFIDHGTGVVIGETCVIGKRVRLYQGVTLGAKSFPLDEQGKPIKGIPRHPLVEDDVVIYGGATILGRITIGQGSVIGGNMWLTWSVAPGSKVAQVYTSPADFTFGGGI